MSDRHDRDPVQVRDKAKKSDSPSGVIMAEHTRGLLIMITILKLRNEVVGR